MDQVLGENLERKSEYKMKKTPAFIKNDSPPVVPPAFKDTPPPKKKPYRFLLQYMLLHTKHKVVNKCSKSCQFDNFRVGI